MIFFCHEIFHELFHEIFLKYFKNFTIFFRLYTHPFNIFIRQTLPFINAYCSSLSLSSVSKPVKGKYLLLCMNSIMYLLLTWYTLIMFLKVLSRLILKIKSFMKYFKKGLEILQNFMKFLNISKWNILSCISMQWLKYDSTSTRLWNDGRSTACQRSLRSQWRNTSAAADPLAAVTLTYLLI